MTQKHEISPPGGTSEVYSRVGGFSSAVKLRGVVFSLTLGIPEMSRGLQKAQYTPGQSPDHELKSPLISSRALSTSGIPTPCFNSDQN
jgi:hypothetical protein